MIEITIERVQEVARGCDRELTKEQAQAVQEQYLRGMHDQNQPKPLSELIQEQETILICIPHNIRKALGRAKRRFKRQVDEDVHGLISPWIYTIEDVVACANTLNRIHEKRLYYADCQHVMACLRDAAVKNREDITYNAIHDLLIKRMNK